MINLNQSTLNDSTWQDLAPDLTPMLDILFILLVFFMLVAGATLQSLEITLPSAISKKLEATYQPQHIVLEIAQDSFALESEPITEYRDLKNQVVRLIQTKPDDQWIIASDKDVSIEKVLRILTFLQSQGVEVANILMQQGEQP